MRTKRRGEMDLVVRENEGENIIANLLVHTQEVSANGSPDTDLNTTHQLLRQYLGWSRTCRRLLAITSLHAPLDINRT